MESDARNSVVRELQPMMLSTDVRLSSVDPNTAVSPSKEKKSPDVIFSKQNSAILSPNSKANDTHFGGPIDRVNVKYNSNARRKIEDNRGSYRTAGSKKSADSSGVGRKNSSFAMTG